jgi:hypothetical protein
MPQTFSNNPSIEERIAAKFYFAGGSARNMFTLSTDDVKMIIASGNHLNHQDPKSYFSFIENRSNVAISRILGSYRSKAHKNVIRFAFVVK